MLVAGAEGVEGSQAYIPAKKRMEKMNALFFMFIVFFSVIENW